MQKKQWCILREREVKPVKTADKGRAASSLAGGKDKRQKGQRPGRPGEHCRSPTGWCISRPADLIPLFIILTLSWAQAESVLLPLLKSLKNSASTSVRLCLPLSTMKNFFKEKTNIPAAPAFLLSTGSEGCTLLSRSRVEQATQPGCIPRGLKMAEACGEWRAGWEKGRGGRQGGRGGKQTGLPSTRGPIWNDGNSLSYFTVIASEWKQKKMILFNAGEKYTGCTKNNFALNNLLLLGALQTFFKITF